MKETRSKMQMINKEKTRFSSPNLPHEIQEQASEDENPFEVKNRYNTRVTTHSDKKLTQVRSQNHIPLICNSDNEDFDVSPKNFKKSNY